MIKRILPVIFILLNVQLISQVSSTYSRYGIGDIEYSYSARKLGMGQLGTALSDLDFINSINPAGWNRINRTRIEFGLDFKGVSLSQGGNTNKQADIGFSGFTLAFPLSTDNGAVLAAGIIPYSRINYTVEENYTSQTAGDHKILYSGSGGLSKIFFGSSLRLIDFNIGATLDYYFGNLNYSSKVEFINAGTNSAEYLRTYSPKGIGTTIGIISPDLAGITGMSSMSDLRIGVSANLFSGLATDTVLTARRDPAADTISAGIVTTNIPVRIHTGLSFTLSSIYIVTLDYAFQQWEDYRFNDLNVSQLSNAYKVSGGFEYRPAREIGSTYWEQIIFRSGVTYEQTQYTIYSQGINQYSVSAGLSLPLSPGNTLDFGLQYGIRGTEDSGLIKENIFRLNFGISLGDIWFTRQEK